MCTDNANEWGSGTTGVVAYNLNHDYTTEPFAVLYKLYVRPKWRKSPVARILMADFQTLVRAPDCEGFGESTHLAPPVDRAA